MRLVECDFCHQEFHVDDTDMENSVVMYLAPGLIFYPEENFGSYNGAEVHMKCAAQYQQYLMSEKLLTFDG